MAVGLRQQPGLFAGGRRVVDDFELLARPFLDRLLHAQCRRPRPVRLLAVHDDGLRALRRSQRRGVIDPPLLGLETQVVGDLCPRGGSPHESNHGKRDCFRNPTVAVIHEFTSLKGTRQRVTSNSRNVPTSTTTKLVVSSSRRGGRSVAHRVSGGYRPQNPTSPGRGDRSKFAFGATFFRQAADLSPLAGLDGEYETRPTAHAVGYRSLAPSGAGLVVTEILAPTPQNAGLSRVSKQPRGVVCIRHSSFDIWLLPHPALPLPFSAFLGLGMESIFSFRTLATSWWPQYSAQ